MTATIPEGCNTPCCCCARLGGTLDAVVSVSGSCYSCPGSYDYVVDYTITDATPTLTLGSPTTIGTVKLTEKAAGTACGEEGPFGPRESVTDVTLTATCSGNTITVVLTKALGSCTYEFSCATRELLSTTPEFGDCNQLACPTVTIE